MLTALYGAGGHAITLANPAVPGVVPQYSTFKDICQDIDDARVFGGIHFRFDQEAGAKIGKEVAGAVKAHNLRRSKDR